MVCPLNGMMTPGTPTFPDGVLSIGIAPLIAFTGMVAGWLTAEGPPDRQHNADDQRREHNAKHQTLVACLHQSHCVCLSERLIRKELGTYNVYRNRILHCPKTENSYAVPTGPSLFSPSFFVFWSMKDSAPTSLSNILSSFLSCAPHS